MEDPPVYRTPISASTRAKLELQRAGLVASLTSLAGKVRQLSVEQVAICGDALGASLLELAEQVERSSRQLT